MSGAGSADELGILQRHGQGCVDPSRGPEDPTLPLSVPSGVQSSLLNLRSLWKGESCELLRHDGVLRRSRN